MCSICKYSNTAAVSLCVCETLGQSNRRGAKAPELQSHLFHLSMDSLVLNWGRGVAIQDSGNQEGMTDGVGRTWVDRWRDALIN